MRVERALLRIAAICAVLLLFAPATGRTRWVRPNGATMTHSAGWDWVAPLAGIVALSGLTAGRLLRPGIVGPVIAAAATAIAFASAAGAAAGHWADLLRGALEIEQMTIEPAPAVPFFAVTASVGTVVTLVLLGAWLRPGESER
jgi:hypothetical protein